ncbi:hypothetical protein ACQR18_05450 [Bradyrhizobium oligotrophicum]|uniref:hypothetical protein n=1 Tax=Bradyrhizobium oligotrophicum TaxID=44255 RepID=UPI003EB7A5BA
MVKIADPSRQCGRAPPSIDRTVESVKRDGCVAGCGEADAKPAFRSSYRRDCLFPSKPSTLLDRTHGRAAKAVVKMSVTSLKPSAPKGGQQQHRRFPADVIHEPW